MYIFIDYGNTQTSPKKPEQHTQQRIVKMRQQSKLNWTPVSRDEYERVQLQAQKLGRFERGEGGGVT